jgi:hypothetical protein
MRLLLIPAIPIVSLLILAVVTLFTDKSGLTEYTWVDRAPWRYLFLALGFLAMPITIPCILIFLPAGEGV